LCIRINGRTAGEASDASKPFPILTEIERDDGESLSFDVVPNVELRKMKDRMDAKMLLFLYHGLILIPKFSGLIFVVPFELGIPG
jgi:hypothetical protein